MRTLSHSYLVYKLSCKYFQFNDRHLGFYISGSVEIIHSSFVGLLNLKNIDLAFELAFFDRTTLPLSLLDSWTPKT